jgi:hypothetical protein
MFAEMMTRVGLYEYLIASDENVHAFIFVIMIIIIVVFVIVSVTSSQEISVTSVKYWYHGLTQARLYCCSTIFIHSSVYWLVLQQSTAMLHRKGTFLN